MNVRIMLAVALATTLAACGGDSTAPNPASDSIAGAYHLTTVNGTPLPFTFQNGNTKAVVTADNLTVAEGGTWTETGTFTLTINGGAPQQQVIPDGGTWSRAGAQVSFFSTSSRATVYTGTISGASLILVSGGFTEVFVR